MKIYPSKSEDESEVTFVDAKKIDNSLDKSDKVKKKRKNSSIHENMWISQNGNIDLQVTQNESESLLKSKKRKHKRSKVNKEQSECIQSQSFLFGVNMSDTLLTDDSESNDSDKRKKRKVKSEGYNEPLIKKKRKGSIEFLTQDIFKDHSFDEFFNSTPSSTPKKVRKKYKDACLNLKGSPDRENISKEVKSKHEKINGHNGIDFNSPKMLPNQPTEDSKLHIPIQLRDSDDNSEILPNKTYTKNNRSEQELNEAHYASNDSDKRKKRKVKPEGHNELLKKKNRKGTIEFLIQDIFKQPSSEEFLNSTPTSSKKIKKKDTEVRLNHKGSPTREKISIVSKEVKSKHEKINGHNGIDFNSRKMLFNQSTEDSKLHTSIQLSDSDDTNEILPNKTHKKNKRSEEDQNEAHNNASKMLFNQSTEDSTILHTSIQLSDADDKSEILPNKTHKKNKRSEEDLNEAHNNARINVDVDAYSEVRNDSMNESIHSDRKNNLSHYNNSAKQPTVDKKKKKKHKKKKSNSNLNVPEFVLGEDSGDEKELDLYSPSQSLTVNVDNSGIPDPALDERSGDETKLGLYSPTRSITVDNSENKSAISVRQDTSNNSNSSNRSNGNQISDTQSSSDEGVEEDTNEDTNVEQIFKYNSFDVDFVVPELHKIVNRASKPTPEQRYLIASNNLKVKNGKFSKVEDKQIQDNWRHFIKVNGLDDKPHIFFCLNKKYIPRNAKRNFLYYLARDMPERTLYSVFKRFKLLNGQTKKGRFTQEEDAFIMKMINDQGTRRPFCVKEVAQHLDRSSVAIEKRIEKIQNAHTRKIKWKNNNAAAFIKYLLKVTNTSEENIQELKDRQITGKEWAKLSKKLDGVPVRILTRAWLEKLYPALFIPGDSCDLRQVKLQLIQMFNDNNETDWRKVNWNHYALHFEGLTYLRVYSLMKQLAKVHVPPGKRNDLSKCLKMLTELQEENIRKHVIHKINYKNGKIQDLSSEKLPMK